ncbi:vitronectin b [Mugil cephalus]|uniref:vitronectin b n=1 Tax=Mugil cephalus TaxID=48193 RepID=UPI001FB82132|nr:vitronectin b [Mugil cephalus]
MKAAVVLLGLGLLLDTTFAAEESCQGRCGSFSSQSKCQCDSMCVYYASCCGDYFTTCPRKITRGDTFADADTVTGATTPTYYTTLMPTSNTVAPAKPSSPPFVPNKDDTEAIEPDAAPCSGQAFDAFLQLKNGSVYAFRGDYFFELDDKSVLPGYPKLIQDVWGISGPISAAFTRINCQGKSYIFKGNKYWRFDGDVLDEDYPRDISVGFEGIPEDIDAAFAVPAPSHRGKEKAYFFKGDKYYQYEFKHQPSHEACVQISESSPSLLFTRYTGVYCEQTWEDLFADLFGGPRSSPHTGPHLITRDWQGIRPPVDAAMVGRVHLSPPPTPTSPTLTTKRRRRRKRPSKKRGQRRRHSRSVWDYLFLDDLYDDLFDFTDYSYTLEEPITPQYQSVPDQNVYFFKKDKYYRVSLKTKRVDAAFPPYPRSIAKYWLGCEQEEMPDASRAEKKK